MDGEKWRVRCRHGDGLDTIRKGRTGTGPEGLNGPEKGLQRFSCHGCDKTVTTGRRNPDTTATDPSNSPASRPGRLTD